MPRLGELLVAAGLVDPDKLEQALRAQVVWGGRLGTNLIELGFLDLDELSRALGRQHNLPAALARHFDAADPDLQRTLPPELANRYSFVPLLRLADDKLAIAGMDPLGGAARVEISRALAIHPDHLVVSVAAEQRMRYQLERVYGIARGARYLRSRGHTVPPLLEFGDFDSEADSEVDVDIPITWENDTEATPPPPEALELADMLDSTESGMSPETLAALIDDAAATTPGSAAGESTGRERRTYVKTLGDAEPATTPEATPEKKALGRIAIRKVAISDGGGRKPGTLADAARAIRRGPHRDRVGDLVIDALARFVPDCEAAMLLVVRGGTASTWKQFCRSGTTAPELAVPLDQPGLVPDAIDRAAVVRRCAGELGPIDMLLLRALDKPESDLVVVPIALGGRVLCVIAIATRPDAAIANVETIATSAGTAFARLIRDASR